MKPPYDWVLLEFSLSHICLQWVSSINQLQFRFLWWFFPLEVSALVNCDFWISLNIYPILGVSYLSRNPNFLMDPENWGYMTNRESCEFFESFCSVFNFFRTKWWLLLLTPCKSQAETGKFFFDLGFFCFIFPCMYSYIFISFCFKLLAIWSSFSDVILSFPWIYFLSSGNSYFTSSYCLTHSLLRVPINFTLWIWLHN